MEPKLKFFSKVCQIRIIQILLFIEFPVFMSTVVHFLGCWKQEGQECENTECIANRWTKVSNAKFCCCREDYCNVNVTDPFENKLLLTSPASKNNLSLIVTGILFHLIYLVFCLEFSISFGKLLFPLF